MSKIKEKISYSKGVNPINYMPGKYICTLQPSTKYVKNKEYNQKNKETLLYQWCFNMWDILPYLAWWQREEGVKYNYMKFFNIKIIVYNLIEVYRYMEPALRECTLPDTHGKWTKNDNMFFERWNCLWLQ
jgi:hypothetical protein